MLEHGCSCEENGDNVGYNKSCDDHKEYFKFLLSKIPSDEQIEKFPCTHYAKTYYQGQFDLLMGLLGKDGLKK